MAAFSTISSAGLASRGVSLAPGSRCPLWIVDCDWADAGAAQGVAIIAAATARHLRGCNADSWVPITGLLTTRRSGGRSGAGIAFQYFTIAPMQHLIFEFWFMMQSAMLRGFATSYPVNGWLIRSGIKQPM